MECKKSTSSEYVRTIYDSLSKPSNFSPESEQHHIDSTKSQKYLTVPLLPAVVNCSGYHQSWLKDFQFTIMSNRLEAEGNEFDGNACYYSNVKTGGFAYFNPLFHVNESASESH
jgi:hypothetical protein